MQFLIILLLVFNLDSCSKNEITFEELFESISKNEKVLKEIEFINYGKDKQKDFSFRVSKIPIQSTSRYSLDCKGESLDLEYDSSAWKKLSKYNKSEADYVVYFSDLVNGQLRCKISNNTFKGDSYDDMKSNTGYGKVLSLFICFDTKGNINDLKVRKLHVG